MFERRHVEELLRINGVPLTAPDEEIKSVLISARWHEQDVETAMTILRENTTSHKTHVDTLQKMFRTDEKLKPETISALLGVDIDIESGSIRTLAQQRKRSLTPGQGVQIAILSTVLSSACVLGAMWFTHAGLFHITMVR
jgi:hypothetical protein